MYRCPKPLAWERIHRALREAHARLGMEPDQMPPRPHVFESWAYASAPARHDRWKETVDWARRNGCAQIVHSVPVSEFEVWIGDRRL